VSLFDLNIIFVNLLLENRVQGIHIHFDDKIQGFICKIHILQNMMRDALTHWLVYCATNGHVISSIPARLVRIFKFYNPSDGTMVLDTANPTLTEMSTRKIS